MVVVDDDMVLVVVVTVAMIELMVSSWAMSLKLMLFEVELVIVDTNSISALIRLASDASERLIRCS